LRIQTFDFVAFLLVLAGVTVHHFGLNMLDDVFDYLHFVDQSGPAEKNPYTGGSGVLTEGLLTVREMLMASVVCFLVTAAIGFFLAWLKGWPILVFGFIGMFSSIFYTAPPIRFGYRGFGELMMIVNFGPVIGLGSYYVQCGRVDLEPFLVSLVLGFLMWSMLIINEIPDYEEDRRGGKLNLVARFGRRTGVVLYVAGLVAAYGILLTVVLTKVDPGRQFEVIEAEERDIDDLRFSFAESPEEAPRPEPAGDRLTRNQMLALELVNGRDSVEELILRSPLIEFETCKALADLVDRRIVREATTDEVARQLSRETEGPAEIRRPAPVPWLAIPAAALLAFALIMIPLDAGNPVARFRPEVWDGLALHGLSWLRLVRISRTAETYYALEGLYPESAADLLDAGYATDISDTWRRPYHLTTHDGRLVVTGTDANGDPAPALTIVRNLASEPDNTPGGHRQRPGVRLLD
jgi:1,4-dihydroxy-2-naphthoate octaprenyltransferase